VGLHRALAHRQGLGDLLAGAPGDDGIDDLSLALGQQLQHAARVANALRHQTTVARLHHGRFDGGQKLLGLIGLFDEIRSSELHHLRCGSDVAEARDHDLGE
jgi:hypothetical protein